MKKSILPLLTAVAVAFLPTTFLASEQLDEQLAAIQAEFNVQVHYHYDPDTFFPAQWKKPSLSMDASAITESEATRMVPIIKTFFASHPTYLIQSDLDHIYLLQNLSFFGRSYGGTHTAKSMYIVCNGLENGYTDTFMLQRLHSEFSSILLESRSFPTNQWIQLNPPGFNYSGSGFEVVHRQDQYDYTEHGRTNGFLVNYSASSIENDFNMISAWMFTNPAELDSVAQQYGKISQKKSLAQTFYKSVSPQYSFP